MTILNILEYPDPFLARKTRFVEHIDKKVLELIEDMAETMFDAPGVGLAAPQVGSDLRLIVYNPDTGTETQEKNAMEKKQFRALINPEIIASSGSIVSENEACLSVPDYSADVKRYEKVTVRALNKEGKQLEFNAEGIQAVIMQHEIDHLNGVLYIDRISRLKRNMYRKKIAKREAR